MRFATASSGERGFTLVEVIVAAGLLATTLVSLAELFALSTRGNVAAGHDSHAAALAAQKIEELRALGWGYDAAGLPIADLASNTALSPELPIGGTGLTPSPATSLRQNTDGWVDYIDQFGRKIGGGAEPPANAVFIRRWLVQPLPAEPINTLVIEVLVTSNRHRGAADQGAVSRLPEEARVITVKTRKAP